MCPLVVLRVSLGRSFAGTTRRRTCGRSSSCSGERPLSPTIVRQLPVYWFCLFFACFCCFARFVCFWPVLPIACPFNLFLAPVASTSVARRAQISRTGFVRMITVLQCKDRLGITLISKSSLQYRTERYMFCCFSLVLPCRGVFPPPQLPW